MAVPDKGWRTVIVDGVTYYWRAAGDNHGINVVVVTAEAFARGVRAQQLVFRLEYDHLPTPRSGGVVGLRQRAVVAPGVVRAAIESAVASEPPFTGEIGRADVTLTAGTLASLQRIARLALPGSP